LPAGAGSGAGAGAATPRQAGLLWLGRLHTLRMVLRCLVAQPPALFRSNLGSVLARRCPAMTQGRVRNESQVPRSAPDAHHRPAPLPPSPIAGQVLANRHHVPCRHGSAPMSLSKRSGLPGYLNRPYGFWELPTNALRCEPGWMPPACPHHPCSRITRDRRVANLLASSRVLPSAMQKFALR